MSTIMSPEDEAELNRLTSILRAVSETPSVSSDPAQLEAVQKAALALILSFLWGHRPEIEDFYATRTQPVSPDGTSLSGEDLMFRIQDPEAWAAPLSENPSVRAKIENGHFPPGSMGQFLQDAIAELKKRSEAGNVFPLSKPRKDE